ncbi:gamma-glutamylcyclotransferase family protein [Mesoterricola sediminis]|uniref:Gamma-glutamylcyclotransferase n=1 Tax=Mesoterricola sediminis TaxID=2927980 RepID=A0AA48KAH1_9BACT|nr:gamma-glutamylcyclotransferase family protein [Mesoterricola sediminis]BDU75049.1 gamma-glutamylcyclotransferase [Mesoterricola sediminis]
MEPDGLFVYGTLREGGRHHRWLLRTHPEGTIGAFAPGRLFHLPAHGYPALVPGEDPGGDPPGPGWVRGVFVGYEDADALASAVADLDPLEGADTGLFERIALPVVLDSGHRYAAWAYVFPADRLPRLEREAVELPSGDWKAYLGPGEI